MQPEHKTDVLIVGAGPVGLMAAAVLAERGIAVEIIDQEQRTATRSYACALHPRTLQLLQRMGLLDEALQKGHRIDSIAFYDGPTRRAEVKLARLPTPYPFVLVLRQSDFEQLLEQSLARKRTARLQWNHRLANLQVEGETVVATIDQLGETSKGYIVASWQWAVEKTRRTRAQFVLGADGYHSRVRQLLHIGYEKLTEPESFAVFECDLERAAEKEVRIVLGETLNALWPLSGHQCRWSLQYHNPAEWSGFPGKDRSEWRLLDPIRDAETKERLETMIRQRAPWFKERITDVEWSPEVEFEHRLAAEFGRGRCWLAGDAAHQTGPLGMQSMNIGLAEADELATRMAGVLQDKGPVDSVEACGQAQRAQWRRLLGLEGGLKPKDDTDPWLKEQAPRLLSCLTASGDDLKLLADQLGFALD